MTETPEHAQTIIMPSDLKQLKLVTGENSTQKALSKAVSFTIQNMSRKTEIKTEERDCNDKYGMTPDSERTSKKTTTIIEED